MLEEFKKFVFTIFICLLVFSNWRLPITKAQYVEENNTQINVQVLQTLPNGTYTEYPAFMADVKLTNKLSPDIQYYGSTDNNGWVRFTVNITGTYRLEINYSDTEFKPKEIYIRTDTINYFYEKVYRLAKFFGGDQETTARVIELNPLCSLVVRFPRAVNINGTVKSYVGLRARTYQSENTFTVEFLDICKPILNPQTGLYEMTNYTVNILIDQTLESGYVTLTLVSNGTVIADFIKLYYLPQGVSAKFNFVVHVTPIKYVKEFEDIRKKLDYIIELLLKIMDMLNKTIIPKLDNLDAKIINSTIAVSNKIEESTRSLASTVERNMVNVTILNVIYERVKNIDISTKSIANTLNIFVNDFPYQVRNILTQSSQQLGTDTVLSIVLFCLAYVMIYVRTRPKEYEKGSLVISR
jgi:hypothetical protein